MGDSRQARMTKGGEKGVTRITFLEEKEFAFIGRDETTKSKRKIKK